MGIFRRKTRSEKPDPSIDLSLSESGTRKTRWVLKLSKVQPLLWILGLVIVMILVGLLLGWVCRLGFQPGSELLVLPKTISYTYSLSYMLAAAGGRLMQPNQREVLVGARNGSLLSVSMV